jgi:hypothetical protein
MTWAGIAEGYIAVALGRIESVRMAGQHQEPRHDRDGEPRTVVLAAAREGLIPRRHSSRRSSARSGAYKDTLLRRRLLHRAKGER